MYKQKRLEYSLILLSCFALALGFEAVSEDILSGILFEPFVHSFLSHLFIILTSAFIICYYWSRMFYYKNGTEFLYVPTFDFYRRSALCNFYSCRTS